MLLGVFGAGVFLAGLELMITAVALPSILARPRRPAGTSAWVELRKASWIVNGYLLVYILTMPLAGRLADLWGARRLFIGALVVFVVGSFLAGAAQSLDQLIAARLVQAVGGGVLVPVGTAAAAHLYDGHARPRALGVIGALTFLGMAAGPVRRRRHPRRRPPGGRRSTSAGLARRRPPRVLAPAWRWVFYLNVPIGIVALDPRLGRLAGLGDAAPVRARSTSSAPLLFGVALAGGLHRADPRSGRARSPGRRSTRPVSLVLGVVAVVATIAGGRPRACASADPFLDVRLFRHVAFSAAALVSLLTGYAFATAIIGAAVFVDRVLYGGPDEQRLALGALAGATAVGALVSGFLVRVASYRLVTVAGLALGIGGLLAMARWTPDTAIAVAAAGARPSSASASG